MKNDRTLLIFDLGNVVVPYEDQKLLQAMAGRCADPKSAIKEIPGYFARDWNLLQTGRMQDETLYGKFVDGLGFKGSFDDFKKTWCCHTGKDSRMEDLVTRLAELYLVVILSNSTETHWNHYNENYPVLQKMDGLYASHLLGVLKPSAEIFRAVLAAQGKRAHEAIFIDDVASFVDGAKALGMRGITFTGYDSVLRDLAEMGIIIPETLQPRPSGSPALQGLSASS